MIASTDAGAAIGRPIHQAPTSSNGSGLRFWAGSCAGGADSKDVIMPRHHSREFRGGVRERARCRAHRVTVRQVATVFTANDSAQPNRLRETGIEDLTRRRRTSADTRQSRRT